ncbi:MAG TPA: DUF883 C-terminal domain-containing protein [Phycisphaerae bacterium]
MTRADRMGDMGEVTSGQLREKAEQVGQSIRDMAEAARDTGREQIDRAKERAVEYYEEGREHVRLWGENVEAYVQEQPLRALLIAAGVGLLLGVMWRRR